MNAVILAGGRGSRLMPLTDDIPKPMLPIVGYPILDYVTAQLYRYGIKEEILTLGYRAECIEKHVKRYRGIKAVCSVEDRPLGTCGSVKKAEALLSDVFIVMSGDCVSDIDIGKMVETHMKSGAEVTVAVGEVEDPSAYGAVRTAVNGRIKALYEKPGSDKYGKTVNLGVYVVNKRVLSLVPGDRAFDFSKDLFPVLIKRKSLYAYEHDGYWSDLGDVKRYYEANRRFASRPDFPPECAINPEMEKKGTNVVSKGARVYGSADGSVICGESVIARDARLYDCLVLGGEVFGLHFKRIIKNGIFVDV